MTSIAADSGMWCEEMGLPDSGAVAVELTGGPRSGMDDHVVSPAVLLVMWLVTNVGAWMVVYAVARMN